MDERLSKDSHGDYYARSPYDSAMAGGSGAGLLIALLVIGAIVLGLFFLASDGGTSGATGVEPAIQPSGDAGGAGTGAATDATTGAATGTDAGASQTGN